MRASHSRCVLDWYESIRSCIQMQLDILSTDRGNERRNRSLCQSCRSQVVRFPKRKDLRGRRITVIAEKSSCAELPPNRVHWAHSTASIGNGKCSRLRRPCSLCHRHTRPPCSSSLQNARGLAQTTVGDVSIPRHRGAASTPPSRAQLSVWRRRTQRRVRLHAYRWRSKRCSPSMRGQ